MGLQMPTNSSFGDYYQKLLVKLVHAALILTTAREPVVVEMMMFLSSIVPSPVSAHSFLEQKTLIHHLHNI